MAFKTDMIIRDVRKLVGQLQHHHMKITKAILFGSYATGKVKEYSDIDVALVSPDFKGIRFYDNEKIIKNTKDINFSIETHPFRPEDFTEDNPFVKEIIRKGIRII